MLLTVLLLLGSTQAQLGPTGMQIVIRQVGEFWLIESDGRLARIAATRAEAEEFAEQLRRMQEWVPSWRF